MKFTKNEEKYKSCSPIACKFTTILQKSAQTERVEKFEGKADFFHLFHRNLNKICVPTHPFSFFLKTNPKFLSTLTMKTACRAQKVKDFFDSLKRAGLQARSLF